MSESSAHRPRYIVANTGADAKPFGIFDRDRQRMVASYADSRDVREALATYYGWTAAQARAVGIDAIVFGTASERITAVRDAAPAVTVAADMAASKLYANWRGDRITDAHYRAELAAIGWHALPGERPSPLPDTSDDMPTPSADDVSAAADAGYNVTREHSGSEDGYLHYVQSPTGELESGAGHVHLESAQLEAIDAAKLAALTEPQRNAVLNLRAWCPAPGDYGAAVVDDTGALEYRQRSGHDRNAPVTDTDAANLRAGLHEWFGSELANGCAGHGRCVRGCLPARGGHGDDGTACRHRGTDSRIRPWRHDLTSLPARAGWVTVDGRAPRPAVCVLRPFAAQVCLGAGSRYVGGTRAVVSA